MFKAGPSIPAGKAPSQSPGPGASLVPLGSSWVTDLTTEESESGGLSKAPPRHPSMSTQRGEVPGFNSSKALWRCQGDCDSFFC